MAAAASSETNVRILVRPAERDVRNYASANHMTECRTRTFIKKSAESGWSVATFEEQRPHLTSFVRIKILPLLTSNECQRILIRAPVKSGKREIVEYIAMRDKSDTPTYVHAFLSAFHRKADADQRKELAKHNLEVFSLTAKSDAKKCIDWVIHQLGRGMKVILHIDECDFGSGDRQCLSKIYKILRSEEDVTMILYSATPEEVIFSGEVDEEEYEDLVTEILSSGEKIEYTPQDTFCGPGSFLDADLVTEATPFFKKRGDHIELTPQGREIMENLRYQVSNQTGRNILILRLSYSKLGGNRSDKTDNKAIIQFLRLFRTIPEFEGCKVFVDKDETELHNIGISSSGLIKTKIDWSNREWWEILANNIPMIIVIDQTSTRSTEWAGHDRIYALHDFRNTVVYTTVSQAQERVNHYSTKYDAGFQPIKIYGHRKTLLLSAGRITHSEYLAREWEARKIDQRRNTESVPMYRIRSTSRDHTPHPDYPNPLTEEEKDEALQQLCCYVDPKISVRVKGGIRKMPVCDTYFYPCTPESFNRVKQTQICNNSDILDLGISLTGLQNPFNRSDVLSEDGRYRGYLRDREVFDYDRDIRTQPRWGVTPTKPRLTICYRGDELGVALRWHTGRYQDVNSLTAFNSMYKHTDETESENVVIHQ